jgi:hypothetical protein
VTLKVCKMADMFAVGIISGQIFMDGLHPFQGRNASYTQVNICDDKKDALKTLKDEVKKNLVFNLTEFEGEFQDQVYDE